MLRREGGSFGTRGGNDGIDEGTGRCAMHGYVHGVGVSFI